VSSHFIVVAGVTSCKANSATGHHRVDLTSASTRPQQLLATLPLPVASVIFSVPHTDLIALLVRRTSVADLELREYISDEDEEVRVAFHTGRPRLAAQLRLALRAAKRLTSNVRMRKATRTKKRTM
jgi:uncharacterized glyoxalase superfamily metalloenzyme YdcJ